jgi:hypothetical protein
MEVRGEAVITLQALFKEPEALEQAEAEVVEEGVEAATLL